MRSKRPAPPQAKRGQADNAPAMAPDAAAGAESDSDAENSTASAGDAPSMDEKEPAAAPSRPNMSLVNVPKTFRLTLDDGRVVLIPGGVGHIPTVYVDHPWVKDNGVTLVDLDPKSVPQ